jgi:hypothetical protein
MPPSLTDTLTEDETRTLSAAKYEGAPGSLATLASGCGPSHPRSTAHGSRLPAISRREPQVSVRTLHPKLADGEEARKAALAR